MVTDGAHSSPSPADSSSRSTQATSEALLRVARECVPTLLGLGSGLGELTSEVGEEFRLWRTPAADGLSTLKASGLVRFAMPVDLRVPTAAVLAGDPTVPDRLEQLARSKGVVHGSVFPLRRHGRFSAARLGPWIRERFQLPEGDPAAAALVIAVGDEWLYAGVTSLLDAGTTRTGGWPSAGSHARPSRAGAKLDESLAWLDALGLALAPGATWLEFGAFPGGMTVALVERGYQVIAVDVNPPSPAMLALPGVTCLQASLSDQQPLPDWPESTPVDGVLCDMNGPPALAARCVARAVARLRPGGLAVHTLKLPAWTGYAELRRSVTRTLHQAGLEVLAVRHLAANRQEVTLIARKML